jgi:hypothetical protein
MSEWRSELAAALAASNSVPLRAAIAHVLREVLQGATSYLERANPRLDNGDLNAPWTSHGQLIEVATGNAAWLADHARAYLKHARPTDACIGIDQSCFCKANQS